MPSPLVPPLHAAIWEGDLTRIRALLDGAAASDNQTRPESQTRSGSRAAASTRALLAAKDVNGNSALHLATRIVQPTQRAIIQTLLDHGATVSSRSQDGWSCLHDATLCDDESLLAQLFLQGEKQLWSEVQEHQEDFLAALERLPDFEVEIFVEAYSWIPGVSKMLPSQTNRISKRGSQLRVDSSMKGLERFNLNHGNVSHVFTGRTGGGKAYILNHDTKKFFDISSAVRGTSSLAKVDLGIHMLLTKELSATSIDSSHLEFVKLKDVKEIKTKQKNGSTKRTSPWTGTKYEMKNVSATFSFRNPVNPKREHRKFAEEGIGAAEAALNVFDGFVNELSLSSSKEPRRSGHAKSMMDTSIHEDDKDQPTGSAKAAPAGRDQELWLPKGQTMEMHLDVLAGDTLSWTFTCNSKEYSFVATRYHDAVAEPVARCGNAKNAAITGSYVMEANGSFVLKWLNTQKGFTLDKKGIKIVYNVTHTRMPVVIAAGNAILPSHPSASILDISKANGQETDDEQSPNGISDAEICQQFLRLDHIPNPMTVVIPFSEYFADVDSSQTVKSDSNALSSIFKRNSKQTAKSPSSPAAVQSHVTLDGVEYRNIFRSLTLLPTPKRFHKSFEAKAFMAEDFPIHTEDFLPVIEFLSKTGDQVKNMSEFFRMKLPPGFPVRFELPMMFTVRAAYTFQKAVIRDDIDPSLFELPEGYTRVTAIKDIIPQQP